MDNTILNDLYYNVENGIFERVFSLLNPKDLYRASRVNTDWKNVADPKIQNLRESWLKHIIQTKVVSYGLITPNRFAFIAKFIDLNPGLATANLVDRFIRSNSKIEEKDLLKMILTSNEISIKQFNLALTEKASPSILSAISLQLNQEECMLSALERDNAEALKLLLESKNCPSNEEWILNQAMKDPKPNVLFYLAEKYPALASRQDYLEWHLKQAIKNSEAETIDALLTTHSSLKVTCTDVRFEAVRNSGTISPKALEMLLLHAVKQGSKVSLEDLKSLLDNSSWLHNKECIYRLFARTFLENRNITSVDLLYQDFEVEKFLRQNNNPFTPLLIAFVTNDIFALRYTAEKEKDVLIRCKNDEIVRAHSEILKKYEWFQVKFDFNKDNCELKHQLNLSMFSKRTIEILLDLLYLGDIENLTTADCLDLIPLGNYLMLERLTGQCLEKLKSHSLLVFKDYFGYSMEVDQFLMEFIPLEVSRRLGEGSLIKLETKAPLPYSINIISKLLDLIRQCSIKLAIENYIDLYLIADANEKCLKMAKSCIISLPFDHRKLLPRLSKQNKYGGLYPTREEFMVMELLLWDIGQRNKKEVVIAPEILSEAENCLAYKTLLGAYTGKNDPKAAISFYQEAAFQEYPPAQSQLAYCYQHGIGVEKDELKAQVLFTLANKNIRIWRTKHAWSRNLSKG